MFLVNSSQEKSSLNFVLTVFKQWYNVVDGASSLHPIREGDVAPLESIKIDDVVRT